MENKKQFNKGLIAAILIGGAECISTIFSKELHDRMSHIGTIDLSWAIPILNLLLIAAFVYCLVFIFNLKQRAVDSLITNISDAGDRQRVELLEKKVKKLNNNLYILKRLHHSAVSKQLEFPAGQNRNAINIRERNYNMPNEVAILADDLMREHTSFTGNEIRGMANEFQKMEIE
jgi:hypothetical protein